MIEEHSPSPDIEETSSIPLAPPAKSFFSVLGLFFLEVIKVIVLAGITIGVVRMFLFKPFYVKGQSMEPNFVQSDYLIIDQLTYGLRHKNPERGDVIVFRAPVDLKDFYLKRIIGLPGERVKVESGKVFVYNDEYPQGFVLEEDYISEETTGSTNVSLGPNEYFVLGDNRDESFDSRRFGPIQEDTIVGKAWLRGWPFNRVTLFEHHSYLTD
ncbi:MAG: signal peptidase I [Candidatus Magasanikbacteria bacterium]|uniref:Signal peptidase I n=1 Tax=Candidatus Magasanikbacteria bacterium CG10_big_fil_rev_8_21_14_0_10_38_6 TaxID=1974647 RepID=A0A2M6P230_9BACT|nr:signal peptidase I [Candidatus Magasanikbacteria bacterium]NCS72449.1 signal peptidase I [Candidatus Magasanikbacteria bacterium]PIR77744.1 MAG: signal peptidase I [Candidatus Magasanikbacteria bacterium CG10_big_fil_rev_8_21_14_0_10_38_6]